MHYRQDVRVSLWEYGKLGESRGNSGWDIARQNSWRDESYIFHWNQSSPHGISGYVMFVVPYYSSEYMKFLPKWISGWGFFNVEFSNRYTTASNHWCIHGCRIYYWWSADLQYRNTEPIRDHQQSITNAYYAIIHMSMYLNGWIWCRYGIIYSTGTRMVLPCNFVIGSWTQISHCGNYNYDGTGKILSLDIQTEAQKFLL